VSAHERERLSAYLDGELATGEHALVEAHLGTCAECAAFLAQLAAAGRAAAALPAEPPEGYFDGFPARVLKRIQARKAEVRARRLPAWTWAAAAALLLAVVAPLSVRHLRPSPAETPVATTATVPLAREAADRVPEAAPKTTLVASAYPPLQARPTAARPGTSSALPGGEPPASPAAVPSARSVDTRGEVLVESGLAREPAAEAPPPPTAAAVAVATMAHADAVVSPAPEGAAAPAALEARNKGAGGRRRSGAAETVVELSDRSAESAGLAAVGDPEGAFRRLDAVRPGSAEAWRRLREDWAAFVAAHPDRPRADEARVRAIEAGYEAWLAGGSPDDDAAWRSDARAYLERADARQAERVRRLVSPRR
jgi:negative regulator of sigma E activity